MSIGMKMKFAMFYAKHKCFPSTSEVLTPTMEKKKIGTLKSGDQILTIEDGKLKTDCFIGYLHNHEEMTSEFLKFTYEPLK